MDYTALDRTAGTLEDKALTSESAAALLPAKLREAVAARFQNSPIVAQRDTALKTFLDQPAQTREKISGLVKGGAILSPDQQNVIASGERTNATIPLLSANDLMARESGSIGDITAAGTGAFNAQVGAEQGAAKLARERANSAFDRFVKTTQLALDAKKLGSTTNGMTFDQIIKLYNTGKPNATQQNNAIQAQSGLDAIQALRDTIQKNPGSLGMSKNPITRFIGGTDAQTVYNKSREVSDILTRLRTGAALNNQEIEEYNKNIPQLGDTPQTIQNKLAQLESIYRKVAQKGQNPYQTLLDGVTGINTDGFQPD